MAWMQRLYETYQHLSDPQYGEMNEKLLPVAHTPQTAHIEVTIDAQGHFIRAEALAPKTQIILPATEKSAGRSSGIAPHPLADKLQYCAPDYADFGGEKSSYFEQYFKQLSEWADSEYAHDAVIAVRDYLQKWQLIADLVAQNVCIVDEKKTLVHKVDAEEQPALFKTLPKEKGSTEQGSALVRWRVERGSESNPNTWQDTQLQTAWIEYDKANSESELQFCLVTGKQLPVATSHPAKLRHSGDKAKIISSNDSSGFTYRGRFESPNQAATISFDATQKAHNALRWLIQQPTSYRRDDQVVLAWAKGKPVETPLMPDENFGNLAVDYADLALDLSGDLPTDVEQSSTTPNEEKLPTNSEALKNTSRNTHDFGQAFAKILSMRLSGFNQKLRENDSDNIAIMALDSATPGRMAVTYYQELHVKEYLENIEDWYCSFAFHLRKSKDERQGVGPLTWVAAPALYKIIEAAYGDITKSTSTLKKNLLSRLLPCIIERQPIPRDIVKQAFARATNRPAFGNEGWRWEEQLGVTCALIRGEKLRRESLRNKSNIEKANNQEDKGNFMALDKNCNTRDYLFGRLLAILDRLEQKDLDELHEKRMTNAMRYLDRFAIKPEQISLQVQNNVNPYMDRLKKRESTREFFHRVHALLQTIYETIDEQRANPEFGQFNAPLGFEFLLGFYSQRSAIDKREYAIIRSKEPNKQTEQ